MEIHCTVPKLVVRCDFCNRKIKFRKRECSECGHKEEYLPIFRTSVWDTRKLFPDLCENCARKIDMALQLMIDDSAKQEAIMLRNKELNEKRKAELGTKG